MKVLLTGSSGFIGRKVFHLLTKTKNIDLIIASRHNYFNINEYTQNIRYKYFDLNTIDIDLNYYEFFDKPDMIIHLAWEGLPDYNNKIHLTQCDKHFYFLSNLIANGLKKVVVSGTCLEYGLIEGELFEDSPTDPVTIYGKAKLNLYQLLVNYCRNKNLNLIWLRFFYNYGIHSENKSISSQLVKAILNNDIYFEMSSGEQERDFLDIDLLSYYIIRVSLQDEITGIINCCSGKPQKVSELVESIKKTLQSNIYLKKGVFTIPNYEPFIFYGSNKKLLKAIQ